MPRITEPLAVATTGSYRFLRAYRPRTFMLTRVFFWSSLILPSIISIYISHITDTNMIVLYFFLQFGSLYVLQGIVSVKSDLDAKCAEIDKQLHIQSQYDWQKREDARREKEIAMAENRARERAVQGNTVTAGDGAVVVIGAEVVNSFNAIKKDDPQLAAAINTISGEVERAGNKEAGQAWARFLKELTGERDKSVLSALWDKVVKLVPDVATLVESAAKITGLFA